MTDPSWQEMLWAIPSGFGRWWYLLWGVVAAVSAVMIFVVSIVPQSISAMLAARILFCAGCALILAGGINSGWQPWIPACFAMSALIGALSLTISRCDDGREITILSALIGRVRAVISRVSVRTFRRNVRERRGL